MKTDENGELFSLTSEKIIELFCEKRTEIDEGDSWQTKIGIISCDYYLSRHFISFSMANIFLRNYGDKWVNLSISDKSEDLNVLLLKFQRGLGITIKGDDYTDKLDNIVLDTNLAFEFIIFLLFEITILDHDLFN